MGVGKIEKREDALGEGGRRSQLRRRTIFKKGLLLGITWFFLFPSLAGAIVFKSTNISTKNTNLFKPRENTYVITYGLDSNSNIKVNIKVTNAGREVSVSNVPSNATVVVVWRKTISIQCDGVQRVYHSSYVKKAFYDRALGSHKATFSIKDIKDGNVQKDFQRTDKYAKDSYIVAVIAGESPGGQGGMGEPLILCGDLDGNQQVDWKDLVMAVKIFARSIQPTQEQMDALDLNGNGEADITDILSLLRYVALRGRIQIQGELCQSP